MKRQFCLPCMLELQKTHILKRVGRKNQKITCWRCKRRRYGNDYEITRKEDKP